PLGVHQRSTLLRLDLLARVAGEANEVEPTTLGHPTKWLVAGQRHLVPSLRQRLGQRHIGLDIGAGATAQNRDPHAVTRADLEGTKDALICAAAILPVGSAQIQTCQAASASSVATPHTGQYQRTSSGVPHRPWRRGAESSP